MHVLVVEDDPKIADFIVDGLRQEKHTAETVGDGEAGLSRAVASSAKFDALVLDLLRPKLDGFGVLAE